jgi:hypothetical protein
MSSYKSVDSKAYRQRCAKQLGNGWIAPFVDPVQYYFFGL